MESELMDKNESKFVLNRLLVQLYGDILKDFANKKGADMYILPSSIHEVIMVPADRINDPTKLLSIVHDANTTVVSIGDVLSDSVYYYDRKTDHITEIVSDEKM